MPLVPGDAEIFNAVYEETRHSVVGLMIDEVNIGVGFIVYKSPEVTVIAVPSSCTQNLGTERITVSFFDGTVASSNDVVQLNDGGLHLLFLGVLSGGWTQSRLGQLGEGESETVFTIVPLVSYNRHRRRTYTSHIISSRCTCVDIFGSEIHTTTQLFSFSLPVGNTNVQNTGNPVGRWLPVDNSILGAPVFNMQGEWVGFPLKRAASSRDMKLGMRGEVFQRDLDIWLAGQQWEVAIQPYVEKYADKSCIFDWY